MGEAEVTPQGGTVRYTEPQAKEEALPPGTLLPVRIDAVDGDVLIGTAAERP